jgi:hypothetical protein
VGDALGAPVEFMSRAAILRQFGPDGITDYAPAYGGLGKITDDTQMTLFTAEGLLRAWVRESARGIPATYAGVTAHAYQRWLATQGERPRDGVDLVPSRVGYSSSRICITGAHRGTPASPPCARRPRKRDSP